MAMRTTLTTIKTPETKTTFPLQTPAQFQTLTIGSCCQFEANQLYLRAGYLFYKYSLYLNYQLAPTG